MGRHSNNLPSPIRERPRIITRHRGILYTDKNSQDDTGSLTVASRKRLKLTLSLNWRMRRITLKRWTQVWKVQ